MALGSQITRATGNEGVASITAKKPVCPTPGLHSIRSSESGGKYRRKTWKKRSAPCNGWHSKPLEDRKVVIGCSTGNLVASLLFFFPTFSTVTAARPRCPCTPLSLRARSSSLRQVSIPGLSWDPGRQLQFCQTIIWSQRQSVPTRQPPGYAGCHSKPTMFACFPSNSHLVWGQFNLPTSLDWKRARNKGHSSESPGLTSDQTHSESFDLKSTTQTPFLKQTCPAGQAAVPSLQWVSNMKQSQQMALK